MFGVGPAELGGDMRRIILVLFTAVNAAFALPRFAILTGMECINCHVNPTGGELRNSYGSSDFVDDHLRLVPAHNNDFEFSPKLGEDILIGGDIRFQYLYDGSAQKEKNTTFQSMEGSIYSALHLFTSTRFFVKYDFVNTAYEAYGLYNFCGGDSYVKVGAFEPSYGIRLDDHTAYTRGGNFGYLQGIPQVGLIFAPDYRDLGVELGSKFDNFFVTVDATNGDGVSNINFNSRKAFIGRVEYLTRGFMNFMLGGSAYLSSGIEMYGFHGGIGVDRRLTLLAEYDWAKSLPSVLVPPNATSNAAVLEATYNITNGLFAMGRVDYFKTYSDGPYYSRYILGINIYPLPHLDFMPQVRFNTTNAAGAAQPFEALIQSHVYF